MKKKFPYHILVFLFPACFIYTIFMIFPLFDTIRISLYTQNLMGENIDNTGSVRTFIGLRNYYDLFFSTLTQVRKDSNPQLPALEADALPIELLTYPKNYFASL